MGIVSDIFPTFGPASGGTRITVTGQALALTRDVPRVLIGDMECEVLNDGLVTLPVNTHVEPQVVVQITNGTWLQTLIMRPSTDCSIGQTQKL